MNAVGLECYRGDRLLFDHLDLALDPGEALQIHGPNGGGKTSLLRILCGLTLPTEGEVRWDGHDVFSGRANLAEDLNFIGHANGVKMELTPRENLRIARALMMNPSPLSLEAALARLDLWGFEEVPAFALSAGQHRRVALARLLLSNAPLWVLDEPFTAMDKSGVAAIEEMLRQHVERGGMVVVTSHQPVALPAGSIREIHLSR